MNLTNQSTIMDEKVIFLIAVSVVLPIVITWIHYLKEKRLVDQRSQIVLASIEKNPNLNVQQFMQALMPPQRPLQERLIDRIHRELQVGWTLTVLGTTASISFLAFGIYSLYIDMLRDGFFVAFMCCLPLLAIGIGQLRASAHDKKALAQIASTSADE